MTVRKDLEYYVFRFTSGVSGRINNCISAINAEAVEKDVSQWGLAAPIALEAIAGSFWLANIDRIPDVLPHLAYRYVVQSEAAAGPHTSDVLSIVTAIILQDRWSADPSLIIRLMTRYRRALKSAMEEQAHQDRYQGFRLVSVPDDLIVEKSNIWAVPMIAEFSFA